MDRMADNCSDSDDSDIAPTNVQLNMADLKREENILLSIYSKMAEQLHRLEVEELELRQKIRRRDMDQTISLMSPNPAKPSDNTENDIALMDVEEAMERDANCSLNNEIEDFINSLVDKEVTDEVPELTLSPRQRRYNLTDSPNSPRRSQRRIKIDEMQAMRQSKKVKFITNEPAAKIPIDIDLSLAPMSGSGNVMVEEEEDD